jgi:hypothetical protein
MHSIVFNSFLLLCSSAFLLSISALILSVPLYYGPGDTSGISNKTGQQDGTSGTMGRGVAESRG